MSRKPPVFPEAAAVAPGWIDTHAHLTAGRFDEDRDEVIARAWEWNVRGVLAIGSGYGVDGNDAAVALAGSEPRILASVGVHPQEARQWDDTLPDRIRRWTGDQNVVAIGECGLDYARDYADFAATQRDVFAAQCALAVELDLPVIVHTRDAEADTLAILREYGIGSRVPGLIHFFTGSLESARRWLDLGLYLGIPGVVTLPNAPDLVAAVPHLPLERLVIETDSPFAAPVPRRGRRNEPAWVVWTGLRVAELMGVPPETVAQATTANARNLFDRNGGWA
ncbi:MAG: TatD family deoxyribonuclease [Candidatus Dadabacteria bacterium]|nr:MAG: TatD family deoxyribonuclease [Candidatus Dadabacteria bacterium]